MEIIKEALRLSASSINSQPWKFLVIESEQAKQRFHDTFANKHQFNQPHAKEASHTLLFAYDPNFTKDKFRKRVDAEVSSGHLPAEMYDTFMGAYAFAEANTDENGFNGTWTKAQVYLALGNIMHVLARMGIASTSMQSLSTSTSKTSLTVTSVKPPWQWVTLKESEDYNYGLPKARLATEEVIAVL